MDVRSGWPCILFAALLALIATGIAPVDRAWAHASLLRSVPANGSILARPPVEIRLWFSEPIEAPVHALEVHGPDGRLVPLEKPHVAPEDNGELVATLRLHAPGTYVVSWKVISADTHPVWDDFTFSIGSPSAVPVAGGPSAAFSGMALGLQALGRWLNLLGGALGIGPFVAWWWTLAAVATGMEVTVRQRAWKGLLRVAAVGSAALAISVPVAVVAQMTSLANGWSDALTNESLTQVFSDRLGVVLVLRLACAIVLWVLYGVLAHLRPPVGTRRLPRLAWAALVVSVAPLLSTSLIGHAASTDPVAISMALDWLHLLAMAVWVGGLCAIGLVLPRLLGGQTEDGGARNWKVLGQVIPRFSILAVLCVCLLALTGVYSAVQHVGALEQMLTTDYGRMLTVKLALVVLTLAVASVNLLVLGPAVRRVGAGATPRVADLWPLFRPLLRLEALLVLAVLGVVGLLTALAPARQVAGGGAGARGPAVSVGSVVAAGEPHAVLAGHIGTTLLTLAIAPDTNGPTTIAVSLTAPTGGGVAGSVSIHLAPPPGSGLALVNADLAPQDAGQFAGSFTMSWPGTWTVELTVHTASSGQTRHSFSVPLPLISGVAYLTQADRATNALRSAVMRQVVSAGNNQHHTIWEFQAPDRMHYLSPGDFETYRIGTRRWDRLPDGPWQATTVDAPLGFKWPDQEYARFGPDAVVLGHDTVDGHGCEVVGYWVAYPNATFRLWIDSQSGLVRRQQLLKPGAFEDDHYTLFNQASAIQPPA